MSLIYVFDAKNAGPESGWGHKPTAKMWFIQCYDVTVKAMRICGGGSSNPEKAGGLLSEGPTLTYVREMHYLSNCAFRAH